jgi:PAS domain S-box-containing protein
MLHSITAQDVFNSTSNGVIATDDRGDIVLINQKALAILGLKKNEVIGNSVKDIIPLTSHHVLDCLRTGKPQIGRHVRGKKVHLVINVTAIRKTGKIAGTVSNFQKMQQFENSAQRLESYQQLSNQFESVFSSSSDGLTIIDGQGIFIRMNKAAQKLNGWKEKEIIGKHVTEMVKKGMQDKSITMEVLRTKRRVSLLIYVNATQKHLLVTGTPVFDENNDISMIVVNERDLTQLNAMQQRLDQTMLVANRYKDELTELSMIELKQQEIIAKSKEMRQILMMALKLATLKASNILILGESGAGKGILAKFIHQNSKRKKEPFIQINCAALPENLLEAELFGYEKGAFTGAREEGKAGLFELAQGGTLFLDEIGDMPLKIQAKLLKYLDDNTIMRLGGLKLITINCTIIAATNQNLKNLVENKIFREDFFFRLNTFTINVPPLRERFDDIFELSSYFLMKFNKEYGFTKRISFKGMDALQSYSFPGNVRELMSVVKKAVVMSEEQALDEMIAMILRESYAPLTTTLQSSQPHKNLQDALKEFEKEVLKNAILKCQTTYDLADYLSISQTSAFRKLKKHGLSLN